MCDVVSSLDFLCDISLKRMVEAKQGFLFTVNSFMYGSYVFDMCLVVLVCVCIIP